MVQYLSLRMFKLWRAVCISVMVQRDQKRLVSLRRNNCPMLLRTSVRVDKIKQTKRGSDYA